MKIKRTRTPWAVLALAAGVVSIVAVSACEANQASTTSRPEGATTSPPATAAPAAQSESPAALPPDGQPLIDFLMANIPELVAKVPCSCCSSTLAECYAGACPVMCGPCNQIGRQVYQWHEEGMSDDAIVARVKIEFPRAH